jgi:hypothetical protein
VIRRPGTAGGIDRDPQHLPVPIGGLHPRRQPRTTPAALRLWRRRGSELVATAGLLLAVAAAVVTVTRPPLSVYLEDNTVHVAGLTLAHPADNGGLTDGRLYTGPAALLMVDRPGGAVVASAVTYLEGEKVTGVCDFGPPTTTEVAERCVLQIGSASVTCEDALRFEGQGSWQRRCSDGQVLTVTVPAGAEVIPMPFPLGR